MKVSDLYDVKVQVDGKETIKRGVVEKVCHEGRVAILRIGRQRVNPFVKNLTPVPAEKAGA